MDEDYNHNINTDKRCGKINWRANNRIVLKADQYCVRFVITCE